MSGQKAGSPHQMTPIVAEGRPRSMGRPENSGPPCHESPDTQ